MAIFFWGTFGFKHWSTVFFLPLKDLRVSKHFSLMIPRRENQRILHHQVRWNCWCDWGENIKSNQVNWVHSCLTYEEITCSEKHIWLVVSNMFYFPFHIWDNPNPIDELIFFKMVIAPPTRFLRRTLLYPGDLRCPWQGCRNPTRARAPWPVPGYPGYLGNPTE